MVSTALHAPLQFGFCSSRVAIDADARELEQIRSGQFDLFSNGINDAIELRRRLHEATSTPEFASGLETLVRLSRRRRPKITVQN